MTPTSPAATSPGSPPGAASGSAVGRPHRRATRSTEELIIGGVAGGLARHLALPVLWVRAFFLVSAVLGGFGALLYAGLWLVLPSDSRFETSTPGAESASRGGRRPSPMRRLADAGPVIALGALALGVVLVLQGLLGRGWLFWPLLVGLAGMALLWRQADEAQRERWLDSTSRIDPVRLVFGHGWAGWARIGTGLALVAIAAVLLLLDRGPDVGRGWGTLVSALLVLLAIGVVVSPWLLRLATDLSAERAERIRTQERADVAAHLHDSVLQTLALIQRNAGDANTVARLARAQERDLRSWLYAGEAITEETLAGALRSAAAEVEDTFGISIDVVVVGDGSFDEDRRCVVAAAREAMVNAAKHAGVERVDVYAEITGGGPGGQGGPGAPGAGDGGGGLVEVFVRDRGAGFDPDGMPADRHGVRSSIIDRMTRHGGSAAVRSRPGQGTEVRLRLPLKEEQ